MPPSTPVTTCQGCGQAATVHFGDRFHYCERCAALAQQIAIERRDVLLADLRRQRAMALKTKEAA